VHTGLDVRRAGWKLIYVPIVLATGMCPTGLNAFFRQQYRWCTGSTSTMLTSRLWSVPMSVPARLTYVSGFCYYLFTGMSVFAIPLIPITLLLFRPYSITPLNSGLIVVSMLTSMTSCRCGTGAAMTSGPRSRSPWCGPGHMRWRSGTICAAGR